MADYIRLYLVGTIVLIVFGIGFWIAGATNPVHNFTDYAFNYVVPYIIAAVAGVVSGELLEKVL